LSHVSLKSYENAIKDFSAALNLNPDYTQALNNRGFAFARIGNHESAILDFSEALDLNPKSHNSHYNRALSRASLGDHAAAVADYTMAIELSPSSRGRFYFNRAVSNLRIQNREAACFDLKKAREFEYSVPDNLFENVCGKILKEDLAIDSISSTETGI